MEEAGGEYSDKDLKEAKEIIEFYVELIENSKNMATYYMSEDVIIDWFGRTIKGEKNVAVFLKSNISSVKHFFTDPKPAEKIGYKDNQLIKRLRIPKKQRVPLMSPPCLTEVKTPRKRCEPSSSSCSLLEKEQGHNDDSHNNGDNLLSPLKRFKPSSSESTSDCELVEEEIETEEIKVKYVTAEGHVEFHRPSIKKLQAETKWKRPCKLSIAYSCQQSVSEDCTVHMVIYEGNVKCRRNLLKEFDAAEPEDS